MEAHPALPQEDEIKLIIGATGNMAALALRESLTQPFFARSFCRWFAGVAFIKMTDGRTVCSPGTFSSACCRRQRKAAAPPTGQQDKRRPGGWTGSQETASLRKADRESSRGRMYKGEDAGVSQGTVLDRGGAENGLVQFGLDRLGMTGQSKNVEEHRFLRRATCEHCRNASGTGLEILSHFYSGYPASGVLLHHQAESKKGKLLIAKVDMAGNKAL